MRFHAVALKAIDIIFNVCYLQADVQSLKDAIRSAFDVMQAMISSIHSLITKVC